jgi:hypothetical protein
MIKKYIIPCAVAFSLMSTSAQAVEVLIDCSNFGSISLDTDSGTGVWGGISGQIAWSFDGVWLRLSRGSDNSNTSVALTTGDMILNGQSFRNECRVRNPEIISYIAVSRGAQARLVFLSLDENDKYNIQTSLSALNLYRDSPDGLWGRGTEEAVISYYDGLSQSERDSIDLTTADGAARVLQMVLRAGTTEGAECDGCEDTVIAEEVTPSPRSDTAPQPVDAANTYEDRQAVEVQRTQREMDDFVRDNIARSGDFSASCQSKLFKILGICVSQSHLEQVTVMEGRKYDCVASANMFGTIYGICKSGQAEVTFYGDRISMNCFNFNTCGMDISTVSQKLVDSGIASLMSPDVESGSTLMGVSNTRQSYCENGESGDRLCVVLDQNDFTAILGSEVYIELTAGNYRSDGSGGVKFD